MKNLCGICLEYIDEDRVAELLPCEHKYHISCIRSWHLYSKDFRCPTCREQSSSLFSRADGVKIDLKYWYNMELVEEFSKLDLHEQRDSSRELQCALCGVLNAYVNLYCGLCETLFHTSCLDVLNREVGEVERRCTECHGCLKTLVKHEWNDSQIRDPNSRIFNGRMRDRRSILTEFIYQNTETYRTLTYEDKCRVQKHVRNVLDSYYKDGIITKNNYTEINKMVSRKLYYISKGNYDPARIDYESSAKILINDAI